MQNLPAGFQNLQVLPQNFDMQNLAMNQLATMQNLAMA